MINYPASAAERDRFVVERRPRHRPHPDPWKSHGIAVEEERTASGETTQSVTVFLTGRECPFRCLMCDLWQYTTIAETPVGAIASQVAAARATLPPPCGTTQIKLYNASSFFDAKAVPDADYESIAQYLDGFARVVVESHPALVSFRTKRFRDLLAAVTSRPALEVALGLETAHPAALEQLHKRIDLDLFTRATSRLQGLGVSIRVFLLVSPPFIPPAEQDEWLARSVDTCFSRGATVVSLIPTRRGNGAIDAIAEAGLFKAPRLVDLERSFALALPLCRKPEQRVFADLWDLDRCADCPHCLDTRRARLHAMNLAQVLQPTVLCAHCGGSSPQ